jgi:hypothetical protein
MSEPIRLLPCPFCGGPPCPFVGMSEGGAIPADVNWDNGVAVEAFVFCHECGAESESIDGLCFNDDEPERLLPEAVKVWQDRSLRNFALYLAGTDEGLNMFPRPTSSSLG